MNLIFFAFHDILFITLIKTFIIFFHLLHYRHEFVFYFTEFLIIPHHTVQNKGKNVEQNIQKYFLFKYLLKLREN